MPSYYERIHGWFDWESLDNEMVEKYKNGGHIIEIGCYKGRSAMYLAELIIEKNANICVDFIDPWEKENIWSVPDRGKSIEEIFQEFMGHFNNVTKGDKRFKVIRSRSQLQAQNYLDNSLDFVFIDGDHEPDPFMQDVKLFLPKIKVGGTIAGHDANGPDVEKGLYLLQKERFDWYRVCGNSWRMEI